MSRRYCATLLTVSGLILGGFTVPSYGQQSCQIGQTVILAINSARTGTDVSVASGDVVVNRAIAGPTLGNGFSLYIDRKTSIAESIKADRTPRARCPDDQSREAFARSRAERE